MKFYPSRKNNALKAYSKTGTQKNKVPAKNINKLFSTASMPNTNKGGNYTANTMNSYNANTHQTKDEALIQTLIYLAISNAIRFANENFWFLLISVIAYLFFHLFGLPSNMVWTLDLFMIVSMSTP